MRRKKGQRSQLYLDLRGLAHQEYQANFEMDFEKYVDMVVKAYNAGVAIVVDKLEQYREQKRIQNTGGRNRLGDLGPSKVVMDNLSGGVLHDAGDGNANEEDGV